jgi:hypothetical protein
MEQRAAVERWRNGLSETQQVAWNEPQTVWEHFQQSLPSPEPQPRAAADTMAAETATDNTITNPHEKPTNEPQPSRPDTDPNADPTPSTDEPTDAYEEPDRASTLADEAAKVLLRFLGDDNCRELFTELGAWETESDDWWMIGRELANLLNHPRRARPRGRRILEAEAAP